MWQKQTDVPAAAAAAAAVSDTWAQPYLRCLLRLGVSLVTGIRGQKQHGRCATMRRSLGLDRRGFDSLDSRWQETLHHVIVWDLFIEFTCFHSGVRFKGSFSMKNVCLHIGFTYLHILLCAYGEHICVTNVPHCWGDGNRRRKCHTSNNKAEDKRNIFYFIRFSAKVTSLGQAMILGNEHYLMVY